MRQLPAEVERLRLRLTQNAATRQELGDAACKLLQDEPELVAMWSAIQKRSDRQDPWASIFLGFVKEAAELPPYHYLTASRRRALAGEIERTSRQLARQLKEYQLDCNLIYSGGKIFHGFYIYEDFGESNRARIDDAETERVATSAIVLKAGKRAKEKIIGEPATGKAGKNARAIRFARMLSDRLDRYYEQPLLAVVKTATNSIFGTNYTEGDIQNLRSR